MAGANASSVPLATARSAGKSRGVERHGTTMVRPGRCCTLGGSAARAQLGPTTRRGPPREDARTVRRAWIVVVWSHAQLAAARPSATPPPDWAGHIRARRALGGRARRRPLPRSGGVSLRVHRGGERVHLQERQRRQVHIGTQGASRVPRRPPMLQRDALVRPRQAGSTGAAAEPGPGAPVARGHDPIATGGELGRS